MFFPASSLPAAIRYCTVDGLSVRYYGLEAATSPCLSLQFPLLLLHGLGCSSDSWLPALDVLANRRLSVPVFVPDFPGFGCSPGPPEALGMSDLADWAVRLMDTLGLERVHLGGNSMGCQVALALARRYPGRVGGLALVGPTSGDRLISFGRYAVGLLRDGVREPMRYNLLLTRMYAQMGVPRYLATTRKMLEDDPVAQAQETRAPVLILRGGWDGIIPDRAARRMAAALPSASFQRLARMPHALQYSRPRILMECALPFWAEAEEKIIAEGSSEVSGAVVGDAA